MREAKETWIDGKHIGNLFLDGKEIKEMWLDGELIYQLLGGEMKIIQFPSEVYGDDVCKIGEYIILYSTGLVVRAGGSFSLFRFKNGEYVDSIKICDVTQQSVFTVRSFRNDGFLYIHDGNDRMWVYTADGVSNEFVIPAEVKAIWNSYTMCAYKDNRLYFADKYSRGDIRLRHTMITATLNNGIITNMNVNNLWGISESREINPVAGAVYPLDVPIAHMMFVDYSTGRTYGQAITELVYKNSSGRVLPYARMYWCEMYPADSGVTIIATIGEPTDYPVATMQGGGSTLYTKSNVGALSYVPGMIGYERKDHNGETYHTLLRDVHPLVEYRANAIDYSTLEMDYVWIPFSHIAYDESTNNYYGVGGYTTYKGFHDGMYQTENPDAGGIWYAQEPNWEQVVEADEPRISYNNSNNCDCIADGMYVVSYSNIYYFSKGE